MPPNGGASSGSEPNSHRSWEDEGLGADDSFQEEEGFSSAFASSTPWGKCPVSLVSI